jgi:Metallo-beta-lactamase superfamily
MREVLPGVYHWTTVHPRIRIEVASYWLEDGGVLIDPLIPPDVGIEWFAERSTPPSAIVLSNRHHYRHSTELVERYGCPVLCVRAGLHEFTHGEHITAFDPGDTLPGGLSAFEIGAICPDEMALYLAPARAIWFADGVIRAGADGPLGFVPDSLMDEPEETKRRLLTSFERALSELDFDHILLAHGGPVIGDGRAQLEDLVRAGGRTALTF